MRSPLASVHARSWRLARSPYGVSLAAFVLKGGCALLMTYWLANSLNVDEFAAWATVSSIGMILSVADFGAGQLVLTGLHERRRDGTAADALLSNAVAGMVLLSVLLMAAGSVVLRRFDLLAGITGQWILLAVILPRLVFIPFGAVLSAHDRYHERKVFEAGSYVVAAAFIFWCTRRQTGVSTMLVGVNLLITAGSAAIALRARAFPDAAVAWSDVTMSRVLGVLRKSAPYFVNNVSGLAIYGGFVALAATVLDAAATARLALLHGVLFMHLYQVFELLFRTSQTRLDDALVMRRLRGVVLLGFVATAAVLATAGGLLLRRVFRGYEFSQIELIVFVSFTFGEIYYLLLTTRMQMRSAMRDTLRSVSVIKTVAFIALLFLAGTAAAPPTLLAYSVGLLSFSVATGIWATWAARDRTRPA